MTESELENKIGRVVGACFDAILLSLTEGQEAKARDFLRGLVDNPDIRRDDKRLYAIIAGSTDEELDELMTRLYGPRPSERPSLRIVEGGSAA